MSDGFKENKDLIGHLFFIKHRFFIKKVYALEEILKQVIELDKESQAKIEQLKTEKKHISDYRRSIKKELTKTYQQQTDDAFKELQKGILNEYEAGKKAADIDASEKEKTILDQYEEHKEEWLEMLISFCLRE